MSTPQFDPSAYLDMPMDQPLVKRPPITPGDYTAVVKELTVRPWQSKDKVNPETGQLRSGIAYDVTLTLSIPEAEASRVGLSKPELELKDSIMLDVAGGAIDMSPGKNGHLRRYREALDMNRAGETFYARKMVGRPLVVRIGHREYPAGSGDLFEEILGVARLA